MPALNVEFTDEEMALLRERAHADGVSLKALAHDAVVGCATRAGEDALIWGAYERAKTISTGLLARLAEK
jgi:hypothetical protein